MNNMSFSDTFHMTLYTIDSDINIQTYQKHTKTSKKTENSKKSNISNNRIHQIPHQKPIAKHKFEVYNTKAKDY